MYMRTRRIKNKNNINTRRNRRRKRHKHYKTQHIIETKQNSIKAHKAKVQKHIEGAK